MLIKKSFQSQSCCTVDSVLKCLYNKATISNFITLVIMVTGITLYQVYHKGKLIVLDLVKSILFMLEFSRYRLFERLQLC